MCVFNSQFLSIACSLTQDNACGMYCAISISVAQLQQEGWVDVFHTVREIRRQRPSALVSKVCVLCAGVGGVWWKYL